MLFIIVITCLLPTFTLQDNTTKEEWVGKEMQKDELKRLSDCVSQSRLKSLIHDITIARPPSSFNHIKVAGILIDELEELGWEIESDIFDEKPPDPYLVTTFHNIIATYNSNATRKLVLACHYDSKITPNGFVGATDSAVPCSVIIEVVTALQKLLKQQEEKQLNNNDDVTDITLQLIFFDGEEAFVSWTDNDSLYGSRHLANKWNQQNKINNIDLLILLDLLGSTDSIIRDYNATKTRWFQQARTIEQRMMSSNLLGRCRGWCPVWFKSHWWYDYTSVQDDHIPFQKLGVPIFHMISSPFPYVWHTIHDDLTILNYQRINRLAKIITVFVAQYLHL